MDAFRKQKILLRLLAITQPGDIRWPWLQTLVDLHFWSLVLVGLLWSSLLIRGAYLYIHQDDFIIRIEGLCAAVTMTAAVTKLVTYKLKSAQLKELFEQLGDFEADTARGRRVRRLSSLFEMMCLCIIVTHSLDYFIKPGYNRPSPYYTAKKSGSPGEVTRDYWFFIYGAFTVVGANCIGDTTFLAIVNQLCHRLLLLANKMSDIVYQETDDGIIKECVQEHIILIGLKEKLVRLFRHIFIVQLFCSFITLCLTLFAITQFGNLYASSQEMMNQMIALLVELFFYCWAGQMVSNHFEHLRLAIYKSRWYDCPMKYRSSLLIIQIFTTKPTYITSMTIFHLNFQFYEKICKETFSYYTVMTQIFSQ